MTEVIIKITRAQRARLLKMIAFLRKLPRKRFALRWSYAVLKTDENKHTCPTVGCVMGWAPVVFPTILKYENSVCGYGYADFRMCKHKRVMSFSKAAEYLFGFSHHDAEKLLGPNSQTAVDPALPNCDADASPKRVAAMLSKVLKFVDAGRYYTTRLDMGTWQVKTEVVK